MSGATPAASGIQFGHDEILGHKFESWLRLRGGEFTAARVTSFHRSGGGWSSRNFLAVMECAGNVIELVVRCPPEDLSCSVFPEYDLHRQFSLIQELGRKTDVIVPRCRWFEPSDDVLGAPFFVMDRVRGDIPADNPPYQTAGFLLDASPAQRGRAWRSAIGQLAKLAMVNPKDVGLPSPQRGERCSPAEKQIDYYEAIFRSGRPTSAPFPVAEKALAWLRREATDAACRGFVWGDARLGNMIFEDFEVVAVLDWETACVGDPTEDLTNFLIMQRCQEQYYMLPELSRPRLEGLPSDQDTIALYEHLTGRPTSTLRRAMVFSAFKNLALLQRFIEVAAERGMIPQETKEQMKLSAFPFAAIIDEQIS
jgi:aminoglycoside phosphotransferase (APT) family kinase protein